MAIVAGAIDSAESSDSNEMKIVEPSNVVDPLPPPPHPQTSTPSDLSSQSSSTLEQQSQQSYRSPTSPSTSSQVLNVPTSKDSTAITETPNTETSTSTPDGQKPPMTTPLEPIKTVIKLETSDNDAVLANESSITSESVTKSDDDHPEPNINNSIEKSQKQGDTENGVTSNHGGPLETETIAPKVQPKSHQGKKRSIDEVTRDSHDITHESDRKKLVSQQPKNDKKQQKLHEKDEYCWICHKEKSNISCKSCPRTYHQKCLPTENSGPNDSSDALKPSDKNWICMECSAIKKSEDSSSKNPALSHLNPHEFSELLMFAVQTIKTSADRSFYQPVAQDVFPDYRHFVVHPMDFSTIERNIRSKAYRSPEAFMADIKYIVHNCYIYNSPNHPLTKNANYFLKVAKNEMQEIDICHYCFRNFYTLKDKEWFAEPCARPHILVYAKMRGYPPWPAKVVRHDKEKNEVDVRFFGAHDRSMIPVDSCSLITKPNSALSKSSKSAGKGIKAKHDSAMNELALHVKRLNELFPSKFHYAKTKQPIDVNKLYIFDSPEDEDTNTAVLEVDDDRDSDLNEDKLVIDETGDGDLDTTANESIEQKGIKTERMDPSDDSTAAQPSSNDPSNASESSIPRLTLPKSLKISLRSPSTQQQKQQQVSPSPASAPIQPVNVTNKKDETPKSSKKKVATGKTKKETKKEKEKEREKEKEKEKVKIENEKPVSTPASSKKSEPKKKSIVKPGIEEETHNKVLEELETLKKKYEFDKMMHREQLREIEHNHNLKIREMRDSWQAENEKALKSLTTNLEEKYRKEIEETKKKLWCSECLKEAMYFCCWNTSYCSLECQRDQWPKHASKCQQQSHWQQTNSQSSATAVNQQPQQLQNNQQQPQLQTHNNNSNTTYSSAVNQQA